MRSIFRDAIEYARERPELILAAGIGAFWLAEPRSAHQAEGHRHDKYCRHGEKYLYLAAAAAIPTAFDYIAGENWHRYLVDPVVNFAIDDARPDAKQRETEIKEYLKQGEVDRKIRKASRLAVAYDVLDIFVKDSVLLPKPKIINEDSSVQGILPGAEAFKGQRIDLIGLGIDIYNAIQLNGIKSLFSKESLTSMAALTAAEGFFSNLPSCTIGMATEIYTLAKKTDEVFTEADRRERRAA